MKERTLAGRRNGFMNVFLREAVLINVARKHQRLP